MSPAQKHRAYHLARKAALLAGDGAMNSAAAPEYELMKARLAVDLRRLHDIQSIERKIELKRELIVEYFPWLRGTLEGDGGGEDVIVTHMMIWAIDIGNFDMGLDLAEYVLRHKLTLPERFDRTAATLIVEEIADAAIKRLGRGEDFGMGVLDRVEALTDGADIFDQVRAKLHKAIGLQLAFTAEGLSADADGPAGARHAGLVLAVAQLRRALELDATCGVKRRADDIDRAIRKLAEASAGTEATS
ncbi:MAG: phage terminase small subunit [Pseudomonadota bacterium]